MSFLFVACTPIKLARRFDARPRALHARRETRQVATRMSYTRADLDHIALTAQSPLALVEFYTQQLGFEAMMVEEFKAGKRPFPSVRISEITIVDFMPSDCKRANSHHFCLTFSKAQHAEVVARLRTAGVHVPSAKLLSGALGDGWAVYVEDPESNVIELRYYD